MFKTKFTLAASDWHLRLVELSSYLAYSSMPVAFLYNRRLETRQQDTYLEDVCREYNFVMIPPCYQLAIMTGDGDITDPLVGRNSVGVVAAAVRDDTTVFHWEGPVFIPHLKAVFTVVEEVRLPNIEAKAKDVLTMHWGESKLAVLTCLLQCAKIRARAHGDSQRSAKRHAGRAQDVLERAISAVMASAGTVRRTGVPMDPQLQSVTIFLNTLSVPQVWPSVATWLVNTIFERSHFFKVTPGWSNSLHELLPVLRCDLKGFAHRRMKAARIQYIKSGIVMAPSKDGKSSGIVMSVDRYGLPHDANPKHCLVLICKLEDLTVQVEVGPAFDVNNFATLHLISGMSADMRRWRLQPPINEDIAAGTYVLAIVLERMHEVVFAYDCLKSIHLEVEKCEEGRHRALRAWCGTRNLADDHVLDVFGEPGQRANNIRIAEERLGIHFSPAQRHILEGLAGPLCVISCVAGAGKTMLLQAILMWVYHRIAEEGRDDISITYCAPTQDLVMQTFEEFRKALREKHKNDTGWAFGFDRKRSVDRLQKQVEGVVAARTLAVGIVDTLSQAISYL